MSLSLRRLALPATLIALLSLVASTAWAVQGQYSPVTEADLPKLSLNHYFTPEGKAAEQKFVWTFAADGTFEAKEGDGGLPLDLRKRLTGSEAAAKKLTGEWKLEAGQIVFSEVEADGKPVTPATSASYRIYRTAPTVIRIGEPQYVFGVGIRTP